MKDKDLLTTIIGGVGAVVTAAGPVMGQMQPGTSMHPQDWTQLGAAILFGLLGFFSNKPSMPK